MEVAEVCEVWVWMVHGVVGGFWGFTDVVGVVSPVPWHLLLHPLARAGRLVVLAFEPDNLLD